MFQLYELHCQVWDNSQCRQIVHWQQDPNAIHFATQSTIVIVRLHDNNNNELIENTQQTPMNQPSIGLNDLTDPINDDMPANWSTNWRTYLFKHVLTTATHNNVATRTWQRVRAPRPSLVAQYFCSPVTIFSQYLRISLLPYAHLYSSMSSWMQNWNQSKRIIAHIPTTTYITILLC